MLKIGQITDLHCRFNLPGSSKCIPRRSRDMVSLFKKALKKLQVEQVDIIILTGDILDVPDVLLKPNDYYDYDLENLKSQTKRDYLLFQEILDETGLPYVVLPGNHDLDAVFWEVFDKNKNEVIVKEHRFIRFCDRELDGQAHRYDYERVRMLDVLEDDNELPQIHLQHYVITPELNDGYRHTYFDSSDIIKKLGASKRVKLSMNGHYHGGTDLISIDNTNYVTGPSFSEFPHPIRVFELEENNIVTKTIELLDQPIHFNKPVAFLDRDGVINTLSAYRTGPDLFELTNNSGQAIANLHKAGFVVVVITSQSCVGQGYVSPNTIFANHDYLCNMLRENGGDEAQPDLILFSTGANQSAVHEDFVDSSNAKPSTVLPEQALELLKARLEGSFFVGDNIGDIETGNNLNIDSYLVQTGAGSSVHEKLQSNNNKKLNYEVVADLFTLSKLLLEKTT